MIDKRNLDDDGKKKKTRIDFEQIRKRTIFKIGRPIDKE